MTPSSPARLHLGLVALLADLATAQAPAVDRDAALYRAQMAAAEYAARLGDHPAARSWLDATDTRQRGLEWRLHAAALDRSLASHTLAEGHPTVLECSPDGLLLAVGTNRGVVELRRTSDGALVHRRAAHADAVTQVRFDRDGKRIVSTGLDRRAVVSAVDDLRQLVEFRGHGFPLGGADFTPDGTHVVSGAYERPSGTVVGTVHVWNANDGTPVRSMTGGRKPLAGLAVSPDGRHVAAASWDFCLFVWPIDGGEPQRLAMPDDGIYNAVDGVAWSPDGALVAAAGKDHTARVWRAADGVLVATLRGHHDAVTDLRFARDGQRLVTASADGSLRSWRVADWQLDGEAIGHTDDVLDVAVAPDGRMHSAGLDGTLRTWDPALLVRTPAMQASKAAYVCRWSPDGHRIATCSYDGRVQIWCADTERLLGSFAAHAEDKSCHMLAWSPDGRDLFTGSYDGTVRRFDAVTGTERARHDHGSGFYWLALAPDGSRLAACSGKEVLLLDAATLARQHTFTGHGADVLTASFDHRSQRCVSCARDGKAIVFDAATGQTLATVTCAGKDVAEACFLPDGSELHVGERNGRVTTHDAATGAARRQLLHHRHGFDHLALSPDGSRLLLASHGVVLVDAVHGGALATFTPHRDGAYHVAFDPAGERIASCSTDRSIAILDPRSLAERIAARDAARRAQAAAAAALARHLAAGETAAAVADRVLADPDRTAAERAAWFAALVRDHEAR
jgi:WD40 repeat protein